MQFEIGKKIEDELKDFENTKIKLAGSTKKGGTTSVRNLKADTGGYFFNQADTITLIDLYWNSQFDGPSKEKTGQEKIFLNTGRFRSEVSSKQIAIASKDGKFIPDPYADPYTAYFMQKDYLEWIKDTNFGEIINEGEDKLPKYGTIVLKKVGEEIGDVPLQVLRNQQNADSLKTASYVIEVHEDMESWEIQKMPNWDTAGVEIPFGSCTTVYERYGYVPRAWLDKYNDRVAPGAQYSDKDVVYAMVFAAKVKKTGGQSGWHVFYAEESECPYLEHHWARQHGRWLGVGVMESQISNLVAGNIVANLQRRSLEWAAKRVFQAPSVEGIARNLVTTAKDGDIIEMGANNILTRVDLDNRSNADFNQFFTIMERNADQKAFTYETATGAAMPSGTPATLGVILSKATNSYFGKKREAFGLFLKVVITEFKIPKFIRDMGDKERVIAMFSGDAGFETLRAAAMRWVKSEITRVSLLSGQPIDAAALSAGALPFEEAMQLFFSHQGGYKDAKYKFTFTFTGEETDLEEWNTTMSTLYQLLAARNDPRAEIILKKIGMRGGVDLDSFGQPAPNSQVTPPPQQNAPAKTEAIA